MICRYAYLICAGLLTAAANTPADIVWSGDLYQRTYYDLSVLDINQDGTNDFTFTRVDYTVGPLYHEYSIVPVNGQIVVDNRYFSPEITSLVEGTLISSSLGNPDLAWDSNETVLFIYGTIMGNEDYGGLYNGVDYLGISFEVEGSTHYGWIQTSHYESRPSPNNQYLYIHGWAYESTPDTGIMAGAIPEPSSGILTMIGSLSLLLLTRSRRRRQAGRAPLPRCRTPHTSTTPENW